MWFRSNYPVVRQESVWLCASCTQTLTSLACRCLPPMFSQQTMISHSSHSMITSAGVGSSRRMSSVQESNKKGAATGLVGQCSAACAGPTQATNDTSTSDGWVGENQIGGPGSFRRSNSGSACCRRPRDSRDGSAVLPAGKHGSSLDNGFARVATTASAGLGESLGDSKERQMFYHRPLSMRKHFTRDGKPLLLPKSTLAAHNGRMLMHNDRTCTE